MPVHLPPGHPLSDPRVNVSVRDGSFFRFILVLLLTFLLLSVAIVLYFTLAHHRVSKHEGDVPPEHSTGSEPPLPPRRPAVGMNDSTSTSTNGTAGGGEVGSNETTLRPPTERKNETSGRGVVTNTTTPSPGPAKNQSSPDSRPSSGNSSSAANATTEFGAKNGSFLSLPLNDTVSGSNETTLIPPNATTSDPVTTNVTTPGNRNTTTHDGPNVTLNNTNMTSSDDDPNLLPNPYVVPNERSPGEPLRSTTGEILDLPLPSDANYCGGGNRTPAGFPKHSKRLLLMVHVWTPARHQWIEKSWVRVFRESYADSVDVVFWSSRVTEPFVALRVDGADTSKTRKLMGWVIDTHSDYDWFMKADDDTFVFAHRLMALIGLLDHVLDIDATDRNLKTHKPTFIGAQTYDHYLVSGGAGYMFNQPALEMIRTKNRNMVCPGVFNGGYRVANYEDMCFSSLMHDLGMDAVINHRMFWMYTYDREIINSYPEAWIDPRFEDFVALPVTRHHVRSDRDHGQYGIKPRPVPPNVVELRSHDHQCAVPGFNAMIWDTKEKVWGAACKLFLCKQPKIKVEVKNSLDVQILMGLYGVGGIVLNRSVSCKSGDGLSELTEWAATNQVDLAYHINKDLQIDVLVAVERSELVILVMRQILNFISNKKEGSFLEAIRMIEGKFHPWHGDKLRSIPNAVFDQFFLAEEV